MNRILSVVITSLVLGFSCLSQAIAANVLEGQKQSLKGITSIRYGVTKYSTLPLMNEVGKAFSELKVPVKPLENLYKDGSNPLAVDEARVKVIAENRDNSQCWVGLYVEQSCQLKRTPGIELDRETYKIGKMCSRTQVEETVKDLCAEFAKDLSSAQ